MTSMTEDPDPTVPNLEALKASPHPCAFFLVMAHRWGATNNHWYMVYGGDDFGKAYAMAKAENLDRGGKYATTVLGFRDSGEAHTALAYFPSSMEPDDATAPHHNHRLDYFQQLGIFLDDAADGKCLLPTPGDVKRLTYQPVDCPPFMRMKVEEARQLHKAMINIERKMQDVTADRERTQ
jgi:hypothetical protein